MKFIKVFCVILAMSMLLLTGCSSGTSNSEQTTVQQTAAVSVVETTKSTEETTKSTEETTKTTENEALDMNKTYSILFIGNSYTYFNDMPTAIFEKMAESAGYTVDVTAITKGAWTLEKFADPTDTYGKEVDKALKGTKKYDFVILQEQSARPAYSASATYKAKFYSAVRNLAKRIRETGATPILYSTWGRQSGSSTLTNNGWTNESMTWKLAAAYQAIGDELNISVAHVGLAFYDVYTNKSYIPLYNSDKSHPSSYGSYLAAATLFAKIFNADPTTIDADSNKKALLNAAKKAVFETPAIPDAYKTTSEGVGTAQ